MCKLQGKVALVTGASKGIAALLASEDSAWINGQAIHAAGGFRR